MAQDISDQLTRQERSWMKITISDFGGTDNSSKLIVRTCRAVATNIVLLGQGLRGDLRKETDLELG